jgi:hypothetical protein
MFMKRTYRQIQAAVKESAGFVPKTEWIAHVKELNGLRLKQTYKTRNEEIRAVSVGQTQGNRRRSAPVRVFIQRT